MAFLTKTPGGHRRWPMLLVAGFLLLSALALEVMRLTLYAPEPEQPPVVPREVIVETDVGPVKVTPPFNPHQKTTAENEGNVFDNLYKKYPAYRQAFESLALVKDNVPPAPHNPTIGPQNSPAEVVVFADTACLPCMMELRRLFEHAGPMLGKARVYFKFFPSVKGDMRGGMFDQLARRAEVFDRYIASILNHEGPLEPDDFVGILEEAGISLQRQRTMMAHHMDPIVRDLQKDVRLASQLELTSTPTVFLNGHKLGQASLPVEGFGVFIQYVMEGKTVTGGMP